MQNGQFNWHELYSPNLPLVLPFYLALLGWTATDVPMDNGETYTIVSSNDVRLGGLNPTSPDLDLSGWTSYIAVSDIAATVDLVTSIGGRLLAPAFDVPSVGRVAYLADPAGAQFSLFAEEIPGRYPAITGGYGQRGLPSWHELTTPDDAEAIAFYTSVTGWEHVVWDMDGLSYHGMTIDEIPVAGIYRGEPDQPATWTIYFETNGSLAEAISAVPSLGGNLIGERVAVPGTGEFQMVQDPAGTVFGLLASEPMV